MRGHLYVDLIPGYCRMPRTLHLRLSVTEKEPMTTQELYAAINNVVTWLDHVSPGPWAVCECVSKEQK